jgi:hypothetical protein
VFVANAKAEVMERAAVGAEERFQGEPEQNRR